MSTAVVVGSGPNGLAAALTLAAEGLDVTVLESADRIGGGARSGELTLPGLIHDECSGFHPLAVDTPFSRRFDLAAHGLRWRWAEFEYTHPLDGGRGAVAGRSVADTVAGLGPDGRSWERVFGGLAPRFADIAEDFLRPLLHVPRHPVKLARFGAAALPPAATLARIWSTDEARALFAGVAAHALRPFTAALSSAIGVALGAAAHRYGWPVAEGGSAAITRAMLGLLGEHGGHVETGVRVGSLEQLGAPDVILLDTSPEAAVRIVGDRMPPRVASSLRRYRHGPGVSKVDFAVEGGVPWTHEPSRRAGTVHVGGKLEEVSLAEREVNRGRMPERPFVLVGQQYVADPSRSRGDVHPVYTYAHVPHGWAGDATLAVEAQIERFAPGFRDRVLARHVRSAGALETDNPNYLGGDIVGGANDALQLVFRPRITLTPYSLGVPGVYLCSAATPPGAGAHGMCGWNAARAALRTLR
ncbi:MAG: NAD(P)/FAD-dependent oxidoreductase [Intrasporangium sp.]|uniref:phytoene desaturase family protein n=1 Tax=Intrasporangium sp. TaxID=1925024 RepID=UPI002648DA44|nr:NAD(P)/FAD-dependent oxidoreductase [Intrasporangium sp.]MDN5794754.1 NAD(P)/FAD-dependent oxidoreductase [Intrasporangium sp.]